MPARLWLAATIAIATATPIEAGFVIGHPADAERRGDGGLVVDGRELLRVGSYPGVPDASHSSNAIFVFDLRSVASHLADADLRIFLGRAQAGPGLQGDLYGVGFSPDAADYPTTAGFHAGPRDPNALLLQDDFITGLTPTGARVGLNAAGRSSLTAYLNARPNDSTYVFFRVSPDALVHPGSYGYDLHAAIPSADGDWSPMLTFSDGNTVIAPEPGGLILAGLGGLLVMGSAWWRRTPCKHP